MVRTLPCAIILALVTADAASAAMILNVTSRTLSAGSSFDSNFATGPFVSTISSPSFITSASQDTSITTSSLSGSGSIVRFAPTATEFAFMSYYVEFDLLAPHTFSLAATRSESGYGSTFVSLTALTGTISPGGSPLFAPLGSFSTSGTLGPGTYAFSASADGVIPFPITGFSAVVFDFDVAPLVVAAVPEPATLSLGSIALLLAAGAIRRKRRSLH